MRRAPALRPRSAVVRGGAAVRRGAVGAVGAPAVGLAVAGLLTGLLTGCSPAAPADTGSLALPGPVTAADVSVTADVYRSRIDPARGGIQLAVRNDDAMPLTIVEARLASAALSATIVRERTTVIPAGATRDLALRLPAVACPAGEAVPLGTPPPEAVLVVQLIDGSTAEVTVPTTDRLGQWADWVAAECLAVAVDQQVAIAVRHDPARDAGPLIGLLLDVAPRPDSPAVSAGPRVAVQSFSDTVLFGLVDAASGERITSAPLPGGAGGGEGAMSIPLLLTPARCDAHALADDKQGTIFRVSVVVDGTPGTVTIVADPATKAALYDAYTRACGL